MQLFLSWGLDEGKSLTSGSDARSQARGRMSGGIEAIL